MADRKVSALNELAATPAVGDELYIRDISEAAADESKRITVANLMAAGAGATKEFWVEPRDADGTTWIARGDFGTMLWNAPEDGYFVFMVPHDFTSLISALLVGVSEHDVAFQLTFASDYAAVGQAYTTHSESDTDTTTPVIDQIFGLDVSGVLSAIAAGDYVGIKVTRGAGGAFLYAYGIKIKYS